MTAMTAEERAREITRRAASLYGVVTGSLDLRKFTEDQIRQAEADARKAALEEAADWHKEEGERWERVADANEDKGAPGVVDVALAQACHHEESEEYFRALAESEKP